MWTNLTKQWQHDWQHNRLLCWLELIGTASSITASVLISLWPGTIPLVWVFIFWIIGSVTLSWSGYIRATIWPMTLMLIYTFLNLIGLYNTL